MAMDKTASPVATFVFLFMTALLASLPHRFSQEQTGARRISLHLLSV